MAGRLTGGATVTGTLAIAPLTDFSTWLRGRGLEIVLIVLGALLLARFASWCGRRITERMDVASTDVDAVVRSEAAKHRRAVAQVLTLLTIGVIWSVAGVLILDRLGVPVSSLVASAAVIGAALAFGAQQLVRDFLAGMFIVVERQYGYGDLVHISASGFEGATGTIEEVALRTTRLRTLTGDVVTVPNGLIVAVTNLSRDWARAVVDVPLPAGVDVARVNKLLRKVGAEAFEDKTLRPLLLDAPTAMGVESFEVGEVHLRMVARTLPGKQFDVARELRARVAAALQREGLAPAGRSPSRTPVTGDARPAAADAAARQAADLDPPAGADLPGRAGPVSPGPARARWNRGQPGWLGVARGHPLGTGNLRPRDQGAHVDGHLHGRIHHTGGVDHLETAQHGTDVDHLQDHRDLGQLPEHDHPAMRLSAHPGPGRAPERCSPC